MHDMVPIYLGYDVCLNGHAAATIRRRAEQLPHEIPELEPWRSIAVVVSNLRVTAAHIEALRALLAAVRGRLYSLTVTLSPHAPCTEAQRSALRDALSACPLPYLEELAAPIRGTANSLVATSPSLRDLDVTSVAPASGGPPLAFSFGALGFGHFDTLTLHEATAAGIASLLAPPHPCAALRELCLGSARQEQKRGEEPAAADGLELARGVAALLRGCSATLKVLDISRLGGLIAAADHEEGEAALGEVAAALETLSCLARVTLPALDLSAPVAIAPRQVEVLSRAAARLVGAVPASAMIAIGPEHRAYLLTDGARGAFRGRHIAVEGSPPEPVSETPPRGVGSVAFVACDPRAWFSDAAGTEVLFAEKTR